MEKRNLLKSLIGTFLGGALLFSCASEEVSRGIDNTRNEFLTISSEQKVCFDIEYKVPEGYRARVYPLSPLAPLLSKPEY